MRASPRLLFGRVMGSILSLNFVLFWAFPIAFMGMTYKYLLQPLLLPIYKMIDNNKILRWYAMDLSFICVHYFAYLNLDSFIKFFVFSLACFHFVFSNFQRIAEEYVYSSKDSVDYFLISLIVLCNSFVSLLVVFYYQYSLGYLPAWLIALYYCSWVGTGGRMMGAAYALAHKEGHCKSFYKKWIRYIGGRKKHL